MGLSKKNFPDYKIPGGGLSSRKYKVQSMDITMERRGNGFGAMAGILGDIGWDLKRKVQSKDDEESLA